ATSSPGRRRRASVLDAGQDDSPTFTRSGHAATDMVIDSCYGFVTVSSRRPGVRSRVAIVSFRAPTPSTAVHRTVDNCKKLPCPTGDIARQGRNMTVIHKVLHICA